MYEVMSFPSIPPAKTFTSKTKGPLRIALESLEPFQGFLIEEKQRNTVSQMNKALAKATPEGQLPRKFVTRKHDTDKTKAWVIRAE